MNEKRRNETIQTVFLSILAVIIVAPLVLLLVSSLKDDRYRILRELGSLRAFWVDEPSLNNFYEILSPNNVNPFGRYFLNSVVILISTIIGTLVLTSMLAYTLYRGAFRYRGVLLSAVIALYIIPIEAIMMPLLFEVIKMRILDTYLVQVIPFVASPLFVFLFYQFFRQVPESISEAAVIEGASFFRIYRDIFLPMNVPAVATVAILQGMDMWNQYLWPLVVTQTDRVRPISVAIATFFGEDEVLWDRAFAASFLMIIPILVLYLAFQRFFVQSVASSAVKG